jgi:hypothetical protein
MLLNRTYVFEGKKYFCEKPSVTAVALNSSPGSVCRYEAGIAAKRFANIIETGRQNELGIPLPTIYEPIPLAEWGSLFPIPQVKRGQPVEKYEDKPTKPASPEPIPQNPVPCGMNNTIDSSNRVIDTVVDIGIGLKAKASAIASVEQAEPPEPLAPPEPVTVESLKALLREKARLGTDLQNEWQLSQLIQGAIDIGRVTAYQWIVEILRINAEIRQALSEGKRGAWKIPELWNMQDLWLLTARFGFENYGVSHCSAIKAGWLKANEEFEAAYKAEMDRLKQSGMTEKQAIAEISRPDEVHEVPEEGR